MKIKQKRSSLKTSFEFAEEELTYVFDNFRTKVGSTVAYHKIPGRTSYREVRLWWLQYFTVFYLSVCAITILTSMEINERMMTTLYFATLLFLFVCLYAFSHRQGGTISFPLNPLLVVLDDAKKQAILDEIAKRRLEMMKKKLAVIDLNKPYYEEASKFSWLKEEGIISEEEYRLVRQKMAALRDKAGHFSAPPNHLN